MNAWQCGLFGFVSYYVFVGLFGMSYLGSVILSVVCIFVINAVLAINDDTDSDKKGSDNDENKNTQA